ncbi:TPA: ATP-dependent DNA helicase [Candidatus Uhrbacteria bacterium]|nr:ATP-dependent DNA helicase [Candidatus Uhrbacteria bacterium]
MSIDYAAELNQEQLAVVQKGDGPTLVLAGAGSGKTRTIIYRVAWLLEQGVKPGEILLVTFTNKAAREMTTRLEGLLAQHPGNLWSGTFHSIANRLLRRYAGRLGYDLNYTILDQDDSKSLIKLCVKEAKVNSKGKRFPSPQNLQSILSYSRNAALSIRQAIETRHPNFSDHIFDIERIGVLYEQKKFSSNAMDFDDLLLNMHKLLVEHPDVEDMFALMFRYILVDEYQDTNILQANIVARLSKVHRNILVVGDDAQSIYSFRAADIQNILQFPSMFEHAQTFRLETNYRSTPEILALANESIAYNTDQFEKELRPFHRAGSKPQSAPHRSPRQEAGFIADHIAAKLHSDGEATEIAVLFRAAYQSQSLEFELMKRRIPYDYRGGLRFFERAHIKDAIAFQRLMENPKDIASWLRVLGMQVGVGPVTAQKIISVVQERKPDEWMADEIFGFLPKKAGEGWKQTREMLKTILEATSLSGQIRAVLSTSYVEYMEHQYTNSADRIMDLEQLALFAEQYTDRSAFLEDVTLSDEFGSTMDKRQSSCEPRIILTTIHQAKGLEWDTVFVMSLSDGSFPSRKSLESEADIQEERRLFYVAVTRARKHLFLTYATTGIGDAYQSFLPSMFLQELSPGLVEELSPRPENRSLAGRATSRYDRYDQGDFASQEPMIVLDEIEARPRTSSGYLGTY